MKAQYLVIIEYCLIWNKTLLEDKHCDGEFGPFS